MSDTMDLPLNDRIEELVYSNFLEGNYVTVKAAAKKLGVKQTDIRDNLPEGATLLPSSNGTLSESRIQLAEETPESETEVSEEFKRDLEEVEQDEVEESSWDMEYPDPEEAEEEEAGEEPSEMTPVAAAEAPAKKGRPRKTEEEKAAEAAARAERDANRQVCLITGDPIRNKSELIRGCAPLSFRQMAKNAGMSVKKLEEADEETFQAVLGQELSKRRELEEYKESRILTPDEFKEREADLLPVKDVFAAGKEAGYGPGRMAQAMGGDRFRHEPLGGFGSVWTPYFYGPRKAWYFDKAILNHLDDLRKPEKVKPEKKTTRQGGVGRKGARGAAMTPVAEEEAPGQNVVAEPDVAE